MTSGHQYGRASWLAVALCAIALTAGPAAAQFSPTGVSSTTTIRVDGITCTTALGASTFAANTWSWSMIQPSTAHSSVGGGLSGGRVSSSDLTITKNLDECSPALGLAGAKGTHLRQVYLTQYDKNSNIVLQMRLEVVSITSYRTRASQGQAGLSEELTLQFRTIRTSQPRGQFGWDFGANRQM